MEKIVRIITFIILIILLLFVAKSTLNLNRRIEVARNTRIELKARIDKINADLDDLNHKSTKLRDKLNNLEVDKLEIDEKMQWVYDNKELFDYGK